MNAPRSVPRGVGIRDVAKLANVSLGTVSNALNHPEKVRPQTLARVEEALLKLSFVPNDAARQLRRGSSTTVGIVLPDIGNPFFLDLARGADDEAESAGLSLVIGNSDASPAREGKYLAAFHQQRVRGVILSPATTDYRAAGSFTSRDLPIVLVGAGFGGDQALAVSLDDFEGGRLAVGHLLEQGAINLTFVGGPIAVPQIADRLHGAQSEVAAHSRATLSVLFTSGQTVHDGREAAKRILATSASEWPDAMFAANDLLAIGMIQTLNAAVPGSVPNLVMVIGYDDASNPQYDNVGLSTIRQPAREMGACAIRLLLLSDGEPLPSVALFQPELVARESTRGGRLHD